MRQGSFEVYQHTTLKAAPFAGALLLVGTTDRAVVSTGGEPLSGAFQRGTTLPDRYYSIYDQTQNVGAKEGANDGGGERASERGTVVAAAAAAAVALVCTVHWALSTAVLLIICQSALNADPLLSCIFSFVLSLLAIAHCSSRHCLSCPVLCFQYVLSLNTCFLLALFCTVCACASSSHSCQEPLANEPKMRLLKKNCAVH